MKIAILDDYRNCVPHPDCLRLPGGRHDVKTFTSSARGTGRLAIRLAGRAALVLIREPTAISRPLLAKLPKLKLIAQTGKAGGHVDAACRNGTTIFPVCDCLRVVTGIGGAVRTRATHALNTQQPTGGIRAGRFIAARASVVASINGRCRTVRRPGLP